jgi:hypothetical protein
LSSLIEERRGEERGRERRGGRGLMKSEECERGSKEGDQERVVVVGSNTVISLYFDLLSLTGRNQELCFKLTQ